MTRKTIIYLILGAFFIFSVLCLLLILTGFSPDEITSLNINNNQVKLMESENPITLLTYNIGYGGLDNSWDSYNAGGTNTKARSESHVEKNLESIVENIDDINPDILLLQEIDTNSKRSFYIDQLSFFNEKYPNYSYTYGKNKDIRWMPLPITKPVGKIQSGLATFSKFNTIESLRYSLPTNGNFLSNLYEYKWAITKTTFETDTQGELVVINVKLSAYNEGDFIREEQLHYLKTILDEEYRKGNYVVVGGNFSHNLPGADPQDFRYTEEWPTWLKNIPDDFNVSNYQWQIDNSTPTFRNLGDGYEKGKSFVAVTDGFLVSDNIQVEEVKTVDDNFQHSNHNPVTISFKLLPKNE